MAQKLVEGKKITRATFKSFVKRNREKLLVSPESRFDGMCDMVTPVREDLRGFKPAVKVSDGYNFEENNLGINGIWLVSRGGDWFKRYEDDKIIGIAVSNSCGSFKIGVYK